MELNKLYLICFLILISLTLGMVNASEDVSAYNMTVCDDEIATDNMDDTSADNSAKINSGQENENLVDGDSIYLNNDNIGNFELAHTVVMDKDYNSDVLYISFYNKITGDFKVFVNDTLNYSHKITSSDYDSDSWYYINLPAKKLKMDAYGDYHVKVCFNDEVLGERNVHVTYTLDPVATSASHDWEFGYDKTLYFNWGEKVHFFVGLPSDAKDGKLTLTIDDKTYNLKIGETLRLDTSKWRVGKHKVIARYTGDSKYNFTQTSELLVCINPIITYPDDYSYGDNGLISVKAPKGTYGTVKIYNSKKLLGSFEIKDGAGKFKLTDLVKKSYWFRVEYSIGDYNNSKLILILMKKPKKELVLKSVDVKKSSKKLTLKASLKFDKKPAKNIKLIFKFNKSKFKAKTNEKGVAKVTVPKSIIKKLKVGKRIVYKVSYGKTTVKKTALVKR